MEKVRINQTVANLIEEKRKIVENGCYSLGTHEKVILELILKEKTKYWLDNHNTDIVTLAKAIQYGCEVEYEFKVGDIVQFDGNSSNIFEITEKFNGYSTTLKRMKQSGINRFTLVCKAENREDLKQ
jgi:hypothetical protein